MKSKDFEKLKQSDRIEFLLRSKSYSEIANTYTLGFISWIIPVMLILAILGFQVYTLTGREILLDAFLAVTSIIKPIIYILATLDLVSCIISYRELKKLNKQFGGKK